MLLLFPPLNSKKRRRVSGAGTATKANRDGHKAGGRGRGNCRGRAGTARTRPPPDNRPPALIAWGGEERRQAGRERGGCQRSGRRFRPVRGGTEECVARGDARPLSPHSGAAEREGARAATPALPCDARKRRRRTSTRGHAAPASPRRTRSHGQAAKGGRGPGAGADAARPAPASPRADCPQRLSAGGGKDARTGEDDTIFIGPARPPALDGRAGLIASDAAGLREAGQGSPRPAADANGHQQPRDLCRPRERAAGGGGGKRAAKKGGARGVAKRPTRAPPPPPPPRPAARVSQRCAAPGDGVAESRGGGWYGDGRD